MNVLASYPTSVNFLVKLMVLTCHVTSIADAVRYTKLFVQYGKPNPQQQTPSQVSEQLYHVIGKLVAARGSSLAPP